MSHSHHGRPEYSRGNSPRAERSLSVTEASFQNLAIKETAGAQHLSVPSSFLSSDPRRGRQSYARGDPSSSYLQPEYDTSGYTRNTSPSSYTGLQRSSSFGTPLLDPQDYQLYQDTAAYNGRASPFSTTSLNRTDMAYSYPQEAMPSYRDPITYAPSGSPSNRGYPSAEVSLSRSMSGPSGPSILPSSAYEGFRIEEPEIARQRRRNLHEARRQSKLHARRTVLPSTSGIRSSEAGSVSSSIDSLVAHSTSSYDSHSAYRTPSTSSTHGTYVPGISASPYESSYPAGYPTTGMSPHTLYSTRSQAPSASSSSSMLYNPYSRPDRRGSGAPMEPVILETPKKPQCWDHGCNGRQFSTFSNLLRHQREKSGTSTKSVCHRCGAEFTRKTARDGHLAHDKCKPRSSSER